MEAVASASECQNEPTECKRKMLNPIEEQEFGEMDFRFENDDAIVEKVRYEEAVKAGKIVEIESDEEEEAEDKMSNLDRRGDTSMRAAGARLYQIQQHRCVSRAHSPAERLQSFSFRIHLHQAESAKAVQTTPSGWVQPKLCHVVTSCHKNHALFVLHNSTNA
ncbi:unnamed protein product [Cyclocybe aegerita]|uniref:Uncharacterized protein n=1 Tax=Cyclocybe aegerita TaxID=1973307 RepID=A0A8S0WAC6_CYCAE|nr:unnamed protein product [Cyclocybe aegerita]